MSSIRRYPVSYPSTRTTPRDASRLLSQADVTVIVVEPGRMDTMTVPWWVYIPLSSGWRPKYSGHTLQKSHRYSTRSPAIQTRGTTDPPRSPVSYEFTSHNGIYLGTAHAANRPETGAVLTFSVTDCSRTGIARSRYTDSREGDFCSLPYLRAMRLYEMLNTYRPNLHQ